MTSKDNSIEKVKQIHIILTKNLELIDNTKISNIISKFEDQIKKCFIPTDKIKSIYMNKNIFNNLQTIKDFIKINYNYKITGRTSKEILSELTYLNTQKPNILMDIEEKSREIIAKLSLSPRKKPKTTTRKKLGPKVPIGALKEWAKFEPDNLKIHFNNYTLSQIRPAIGSLLSSAEKKQNKKILIDTIVSKVKKLKTHYKMGPS